MSESPDKFLSPEALVRYHEELAKRRAAQQRPGDGTRDVLFFLLFLAAVASPFLLIAPHVILPLAAIVVVAYVL